MFNQEAQRGAYMDAFFRQYPNIAISWIRDLGKSSHGSAALALLQDAEGASNLEAKHVSSFRLECLSDYTDSFVKADVEHRKIVISGSNARFRYLYGRIHFGRYTSPRLYFIMLC